MCAGDKTVTGVKQWYETQIADKTKRREVKLAAVRRFALKGAEFFLDHPDLRETPCLVSFHILLGHFPIQIIIRDRPNTFLIFPARVKNADISDDVLMNVPKH